MQVNERQNTVRQQLHCQQCHTTTTAQASSAILFQQCMYSHFPTKTRFFLQLDNNMINLLYVHRYFLNTYHKDNVPRHFMKKIFLQFCCKGMQYGNLS